MTNHAEYAAQRRSVAPPISAKLWGIWYNGAYNRVPRRRANAPRPATEGLVPMRPNDTRIPSKSEYCTITVPTGGGLSQSLPFVDVRIDRRFRDALSAHQWRATGKIAGVVRVDTRMDGRRIGIASVVWRLAYGRHPQRIAYINGDKLDVRVANLNCVGIEREVVTSNIDHLGGRDHVQHAHIDVRSNLRSQARLELAQREKDAALLGRSNTRAQRKRSGAGLSESRRRAILDRDGGICFYCEYEADQVDHIIPYAHGGTDDDNNLVACCQICNLIASDKVFDTLEQKRDFIRDQYGPWMKKRYRRLLRKLSICADCHKVYNPQQKGATVVLCKECCRADCLGLNGELA